MWYVLLVFTIEINGFDVLVTFVEVQAKAQQVL